MQVSYPVFPVIFALGILQASWCHPLSITAVRFEPAAKGEKFKKADVEFSKSIEVKGMEVSLEKDNPFLRMPLSPSKEGIRAPRKGGRGEGYSNIRILSRRMHDLLLGLQSSSFKPRAWAGQPPSCKVSSARKLSSPYRIANVEVEFDGDLIVTFGLMRSKSSGYWVSYPESLRIINPQLKRDVKKAVISEGLKTVKSKQ